ncbi:hypothetical protein B0O80DRAFT_119112 [Mortierella sp. GBAus27b]|nr:hypothetical protein B0O80DRAFT_119112 [Mortierella sp. GBAus27b]
MDLLDENLLHANKTLWERGLFTARLVSQDHAMVQPPTRSLGQSNTERSLKRGQGSTPVISTIASSSARSSQPSTCPEVKIEPNDPPEAIVVSSIESSLSPEVKMEPEDLPASSTLPINVSSSPEPLSWLSPEIPPFPFPNLERGLQDFLESISSIHHMQELGSSLPGSGSGSGTVPGLGSASIPRPNNGVDPGVYMASGLSAPSPASSPEITTINAAIANLADWANGTTTLFLGIEERLKRQEAMLADLLQSPVKFNLKVSRKKARE